MKTTAAFFLALAMFAGAAAPSLAQSTWTDCPFEDASMCVVESISPLND